MVFAIFALMGPPIAVLIFIGLLPLIEQGRSIAPESIEDLVRGIGRLVAIAYVVGGLQMGATGLVAALWLFLRRRERVSLVLVLLVALVLAIAAVLVLAKPMSMPAPDPGIVAIVIVLHVGAAAGCWLIANALLWALERPEARTVTP
jgi:hypothetical protein